MRVIGTELSHSFAGTGALFSDLSFTFSKGDLVAVTGPSGSGKSTLLSILAGWETPTSGAVRWEDIDSIAWVLQNPVGVHRRAVLDHVALPLLTRGLTRRQADDEGERLLDRFGLGAMAGRRFSALSGGEAQRLMLARAVAKAPALLLVDEPTAQLDRAAAHAVNDVLSAVALESGIVVIATHDSDTQRRCPILLDLEQRDHG